MKVRTCLLIVACLFLASCATKPTASNYGAYMNDPGAQAGTISNINKKVANKAAWNKVKITQMTAVRRTKDGKYATNPSAGLLTVRAVIVNSGKKPAQGNWRCRFFDSNNMPLYEQASNQTATTPKGLGWHTMVVYPLKSKSQTDDANVVRCQAKTPEATNYRVEFHDTKNDVTVYHR